MTGITVANLSVSRTLDMASHISRNYIQYPFYISKNGFGTPKTTAGKKSFL
jgi:hypothetical protein